MNYYEAFRRFVKEQNIERKHAMLFKGQATTYQELLEKASRTATVLNSECGVSKGQVVGLYMNNCIEYIACLLGIAKIGAASLPIDTLLTHYEIQPMLEVTETQAVIVSPQFLPTVEEMNPKLPNLRKVIVQSEECSHGTLSYFDLLKRAEPLPDSETKGESDDPMLILFTSGTTGLPKGVPLTHKNLLAIIDGMQECFFPFGEMVVLQPLPFSHVFGLHSLTMSCLFLKTPVVLMDRWNGEEAAKLIEACRVSWLFAVPTIIIDLLNYVDKYDLSSLNMIISGGTSLPAALVDRVKQSLHVSLGNCMGLTEGSGVSCAMPVGIPEKFGSIGPPLHGIECRIVDDNDNELPRGEIGELVQRGASNMNGYLKAPEATSQALRGGWLHTGDLARMDEDGYVYIVDRKKDMIVRGGYNIFPTEVEAAIYEYPKVSEAAVFSVTDARKGETVGAAVVARPGETLTSEEIIEHCQKRLARYKIPKYIKIMDSLPKSPTGKILRRELRSMEMTA